MIDTTKVIEQLLNERKVLQDLQATLLDTKQDLNSAQTYYNDARHAVDMSVQKIDVLIGMLQPEASK